jgi:methionine sulfoxide reductase heme-binding subunit
MSAIAAGAAGTQYLWFLSRSSGVALLALFSVVIALGVATRLGSAPRWLARFAMAELHRSLSLFAVVLLALHVVTAILDPYVTIGWAASVLPFASPYRTLAVGLGALTVDLAGAVIVTSLVRTRISYRVWRAVHWLAYLAWPAAFVHSLTAGGDLRVWWVALSVCCCAVLVASAVIVRLLSHGRPGQAPTDPRAHHRELAGRR